MSMELVILMAIASVASALVLLGRLIGLRTILKHATLIDVGFAVIAGFALHGSLTGILVAIVGGLVMALVLQSGRMILRAYDRGYDAALRAAHPMRDVTPVYGGTVTGRWTRGEQPKTGYNPYEDPAMPHVDFGA